METVIAIPQQLVYEVIDGKPIYYKNYQKVLNHELNIESIMGCSSLQAIIVSLMLEFLYKNLGSKKYFLATNEAGLHLSKNENLSSDIMIYDKSVIQRNTIDKKYFDYPPKIVIEIDVQAETNEFETFDNDVEYVYTKTKQLLNFGVEKVIWVFTSSKKITVATPKQSWITSDWDTDIALFDDYIFNLNTLVVESELF